jgi:hypothetical protein
MPRINVNHSADNVIPITRYEGKRRGSIRRQKCRAQVIGIISSEDAEYLASIEDAIEAAQSLEASFLEELKETRAQIFG